MKNNFHSILSSTSIKKAVKLMDSESTNSLIVVNELNKIMGVFTYGDFRRAVLTGLDINEDISLLVNKDFKYLVDGYAESDARDLFINNRSVLDLPVLNKLNEVIEVVHRKNIFTEDELEHENNKIKETPVVIMAGGKGSRMEPFTRVLPKPLIPVGDKPVIEVIMDEFRKFGMSEFHISLNDKAQMIRAYFHDHDLPYSIKYIEEEKPLGTAGALKFLQDVVLTPFFVSNCDIIIHADFSAILDFHTQGKYGLTLVASMRHYVIPYGVCDVGEKGELIDIDEKPEYNFLVNTGLYILDPNVLEIIPTNTYFDMPDLIHEAKKRGIKVGVFPVSEKSWNDIGQWAEYRESLQNLQI